MTAPYRDLLSQIRLAFPQPVSDRIHDSYFVFLLMRAIDRIDALKSEMKVYVLSPFVDEADVELLVSKVIEARRHVLAETPAEARRG